MAKPTTTTSSFSSIPLVELNTDINLSIKLNSTNYPTWHTQIFMLLIANNLQGYVDGTIECPPAQLGTDMLLLIILYFFIRKIRTITFFLLSKDLAVLIPMSFWLMPHLLMMLGLDWIRLMPIGLVPKSCLSKNVLPPSPKALFCQWLFEVYPIYCWWALFYWPSNSRPWFGYCCPQWSWTCFSRVYCF